MSHQNSTISVNTIEPQSGTTLTIGQSGQNVVINADSIKNNVMKDAGGNALFTSNGSGVLSGLNAGFGSAQALISTQTPSGVASVNFTSGIDSTYKEYVFYCINMNPASNSFFQFQCSTDGGSTYNTTITSTFFKAYMQESGSSPGLGYVGSDDQAQGTAYQNLMEDVSNVADSGFILELHLFNPSSTTYVKNFYARGGGFTSGPTQNDTFPAGYFNTTSAIYAISFKFSSGNIDAGKIKMYGIK